MDDIKALFKNISIATIVVYLGAGYWLVDLVSKKFEKDAIVFKIFRFIIKIIRNFFLHLKEIVFWRKKLIETITVLSDDIKATRKDLQYDSDGTTVVQAIKGIEGNIKNIEDRQIVMFEKVNGIQNKQAIKDNEDKGLREISNLPEFESSPDGKLLEVNKEWMVWLGVDKKSLILGTGYVKILTEKQIEIFRLQQLIGTVQENDFDDIVEYQHYETHKPMKGMVRAIIIKDINNIPVKIIGKIVPLDWEVGYKKTKQTT